MSERATDPESAWACCKCGNKVSADEIELIENRYARLEIYVVLNYYLFP